MVDEHFEEGEYEYDDEWVDTAAVVKATLVELDGGPLPLSELRVRLQAAGALPEDFEDEDLDEVLLVTDDTWVSENETVGGTDRMFDACVLTHRVSASEVERGVLDVVPDFCGFGFGRDRETGGDESRIRLLYAEIGDGKDVVGLDPNGSFVGPDGWLADVRSGDVVGLRRRGGTWTLERVTNLLPGLAETEALAAAFSGRHIEGIGEELDPIVLDALCGDHGLFRVAVHPLVELLEAGGIECDGAWCGPKDEKWVSSWKFRAMAAALHRRIQWGFDECCESAFEVVQSAWSALVLGKAGPTDWRAVASALGHSTVAPAFVEKVFEDFSPELVAAFSSALAELPESRAAPGLYLRALSAEREGDVTRAEKDLERAVLADGSFEPAALELAWFAATRGDALRALALFRRGGVDEDYLEIRVLETELPVRPRVVGRNDPCPCGSGRKFKACCIEGSLRPIEERASWLYHKAIAHTLRRARSAHFDDLVETLQEVSGRRMRGLFPLLADAAAFEGGGLAEFLATHGVLLPEDERSLAQRWVSSRLALYEVVDAVPGESVTWRDCRGGEQLTMRERTASKTMTAGDYFLGRVLPTGATGGGSVERGIFGAPLRVELRQRSSAIELLDAEPDAEELAWWLGRTFAPPRVTNRESEDLVLCRLRLGVADWEALEDFLGRRFRAHPDGQVWVEVADIAGESIIRSRLVRDGEDLVVETNSHTRLARVKATLAEPGGGLVLLEEEFSSIDEVLARKRELEEAGELEAGELEAGGLEAAGDTGWGVDGDERAQMVVSLQAFIEQKEREWVDQAVPALGGLTPRQALDDPTRREDLMALLRDFERMGAGKAIEQEDGSVSGTGFDASRLRVLLGIDHHGGR